MKIYTVTQHFLEEVRGLFPQHSVEILPEVTKNIIADLIVFTGGADVNPSLYGGVKKRSWYDEKRDEIELSALREIRLGKLRTTKVLGICRGLQLLNVGFGGTLVHDISDVYGSGHSYTHDIKWHGNNAFSGFLHTVNSMHHQGISRIGTQLHPEILGIEPRTQLIEAIIWEDKYLAFQFHPELFPDISENKKKIADVILEWIKGNLNIFSDDSEPIKLKPRRRILAEYHPVYEEE